jgi:hypothetical protein
MSKRPGQREDESAMEYLRRVVSVCDCESEGVLGHLKTVDAVLDFFDLWHTYDTEFWDGVLDSIRDGANPEPAEAFVSRHQLGEAWRLDISEAKASATPQK